MKRKATLRTIVCASLSCSMSLMSVGGAFAQEPAAASATAERAERAALSSNKGAGTAPAMEEMLVIIRRLEGRVKELESKIERGKAEGSEGLKASTPARPVTPPEPVAATARPAPADKVDEEKQNNGILWFFRNTELSGFVDAYYGYNFNRPASGINQLRNFDTEHNRFAFNMAEFALEKKVTPDSRLGFRMDLNFGQATETVHSAEPAGKETYKHIQQAYLSYLAPAGNGLQIDVGKFVTPYGFEVIETKDNWNYSRGLLFALAIPYYHFGVRASYPINDKVSLAGFVVNGWNNVFDNNTGKSYGAALTVKPTPKWTIVQGYMAGPEAIGIDEEWRHISDTVVSYAVNDKLTLAANYDYGRDKAAGAHWQGIAGYARIQANDWLAFTPRFEWYDDHDGFSTGLAQKLKEFTLTSEQKINKGLITRFEYRRDNSDEFFFAKQSSRLVKAQSTFTFGLMYAFSSKAEQ